MVPCALSLLTVLAVSCYLVPFEKDENMAGSSTPNSYDNAGAELFWIGIFSFTTRAAMSISYDDEETNPVHCRIMCLIGVVYCFLVDRSLFAYTFSLQSVVLGATIAVLTLCMLAIHSKLHDEEREAAEKAERDQKVGRGRQRALPLKLPQPEEGSPLAAPDRFLESDTTPLIGTF